jgi:polyisoprenoid-binding protein YceI
MKKMALIFGLAWFTIYNVGAQTWTLDKSHGKLGFSITHMKISEVEGAFKKFDITVNSSKPDFTDAIIELTADVNSISTENEMRDEHIKNPDYFDANKYPLLNFKSTMVKKLAGKNYAITGLLTMHGISKTVTFNAILNGIGENPMSKKTMAGFKITGIIKRLDFNIGEESMMLGNEVSLSANFELMKN